MARRHARNSEREPTSGETLEAFKAFLGPIAARYSDAQLVQLRTDMRAAARLLLDLYFLKKGQNSKPDRRSLDNSGLGT
jgi:hypothetical protein